MMNFVSMRRPSIGLCLTALTFLVGATIVDSVCPDGWLSVYPTKDATGTEQCFKIFGDKQRTFNESHEFCKTMGGYLARDTTINIHRELSSYLYQVMNTAGVTFWIGLTDTDENHLQWKWIDGPQLGSYKAWYGLGFLKSRTQQNCVYTVSRYNWLVRKSSWHWQSTTMCAIPRSFICQLPANSQSSLTTVTPTNIKCPEGWTAYPKRNLCLYLSEEPKNHENAKKYCQGYIGDLVKITDIEMNAFVNDLIRQKKASYLIGLTDLGKEGVFTWNDETNEAKFTHWLPGEPNNSGDEDCVRIMPYYPYKWNDVSCSSNSYFICQAGPLKDVIIPPSTTPTSSFNCGNDWEEDKTSIYCYQIHRDRLSWNKAQETCAKEGGNLASVHSPEQQFYLIGRLQSYDDNFFWIGASDRSTEGGWRWSDKSAFAYLNWVRKPGDRRDQNCAAMVPGTGKWDDLSCTSEYGYICQKTGQRTLPTIQPTTSPISAPNGKKWGCPPSWIGFRGSCYGYFVSKSVGVTWDIARTFCRSQKADLISIADQEENDFVLSNVPIKDGEKMWIGLNDKAKENTFVWSDNTPVNWTNWAYYEPNGVGGGEDCTVLYTGKYYPGRWNDDACSDSSHFHKVVGCKKGKAFRSSISHALTDGCPKNAYGYQDKCYVFSSTARSFSDAENYCKSANGHLATVNDNFVQAFLTPYLSRRNGPAYWIGLSSTTASQNRYTWTSGSKPLHFTNWARSPTGREKNICVAMQVARPSGLWTMNNCNSGKLPLICEIGRVGYTAATTRTTVAQTLPCPTDWYTFGNMCYKAFGSGPSGYNYSLTWREARSQCESFAKGGTLTSLGNKAFSSWLSTKISNSNLDLTQKFWIGLNDLDLEDDYKWTDGAAASWANWNTGEPNNSGRSEDCVEWDLSQGEGRWNDAHCSLALNYICQLPRGSVLNTPRPTVSLGPRGGLCGDSNWTYSKVTKQCYYVSPENGGNATASWFGARRFCHSMGAELVSITSNDENDLVVTLVSKSSGIDFWIGMNDIGSDAHRWVDGTFATFWAWNTGEPNDRDGLERCVEITSFGMWNDARCNKNQGYICKRRAGSYNPPIQPTRMPTGGCPVGFSTHDLASHCYQLYGGGKQKASFETARDICKELSPGGDLAVIHNPFENQFISTLLIDVQSPVWIGFFKPEGKGFAWVDSSETNYANWGRKNLIDTKAGAVILGGTQDVGKWASKRNTEEHPYLCQAPKSPQLPKQDPDKTHCNNGYQRFGNSCYKYVQKVYTQAIAEQLCIEEHGHLMSISDGYESAFFDVLPAEAPAELWTGLKYDPKSELYRWSDESPVSFVQWGVDQPRRLDSGGCVSSNISSHWEDTSCLKSLPFVCEVNLGTLPSPVPTEHGDCPKSGGWTAGGQHCYYIEGTIRQSRGWARKDCQSRGGSLSSILTKEEERVIRKLIGSNTNGFWIGLMPGATSGYKWDDGSPVNYFKLDNKADSDTGIEEVCLTMHIGSSYWYKSDCSSKYGYICKTRQIPASHQTDVYTSTSTIKTVPRKSSSTAAITPEKTTSIKMTRMKTTTRSTPTQTLSVSKTQTSTSSIKDLPSNQPQLAKRSSSDGGLSNGGVAGIAIGVIAIVVIAVLLTFVVKRGYADGLLKSMRSSKATDSRSFDNVLYSNSGKVTMSSQSTQPSFNA